MTNPILPSRRDVLASGPILSAALIGCVGAEPSQEASQLAGAAPSAEDHLDAAYERFHGGYPAVTVERSSHAPMAVEALAGLGHHDAIRPWLDAHLEDATPDRTAREPIGAEAWRDALGKLERFVDWRELFLGELRHDDWRAVLRRWGGRLAPGLSAAAFHGVIRTGHAVRAITARDNALRRAELATGLAYWASSYQPLPWDGTSDPAASVSEAVKALRTRSPEMERPRGNLVAGLRSLDEVPSFRPVAGRVDVRDPARALTEIAAAFAHVYLRHPNSRIGFAHAVTGPSAVRLVVAHLDEASAVACAR